MSALKVFLSQVDEAEATPAGTGVVLNGQSTERVWIQGIVVESQDLTLVVDDGTSIAHVFAPEAMADTLRPGAYVSLICLVSAMWEADQEIVALRLVSCCDLSDQGLTAEMSWYLEVVQRQTSEP
mmetsp:Transcript_6369/g.13447  ORF Transcript_6369/g.13447 Transcript_6369/m.13447 type:complete len:125 (+) Transcript_6369:39-413(+)